MLFESQMGNETAPNAERGSRRFSVRSSASLLPLLPKKEERAGERRPFYVTFPSLQLSPRSFLTGREGKSPRRFSCRTLLVPNRSEEHTSELQSRLHLVCRLLLEKKKKIIFTHNDTSGAGVHRHIVDLRDTDKRALADGSYVPQSRHSTPVMRDHSSHSGNHCRMD